MVDRAEEWAEFLGTYEKMTPDERKQALSRLSGDQRRHFDFLRSADRLINFIDFEARQIEAPGFLVAAQYEQLEEPLMRLDRWVEENDVEVLNIETVLLPNLHSSREEGTRDISLGTSGEGYSTWHQFFRVWYRSRATRQTAQEASTDERLERNKENVKAFYDLVFNRCKPAEAIENYAGDVYIQHKPEVADGKKGFIEYFERLARENLGKWVHFKRVVAEGDLVVLHYHQVWPGHDGHAGIAIFRLDEQGKIVEHWDVLQAIPEVARHGNTMF